MDSVNRFKSMMNKFNVVRQDISDGNVYDIDSLVTGIDPTGNVFVNLPLTITYRRNAIDGVEIHTVSAVFVQNRITEDRFILLTKYHFAALLRYSLVGGYPYNDLANLEKLFKGQTVKQHQPMVDGNGDSVEDPDSWIEITLNKGVTSISIPFDMSKQEIPHTKGQSSSLTADQQKEFIAFVLLMKSPRETDVRGNIIFFFGVKFGDHTINSANVGVELYPELEALYDDILAKEHKHAIPETEQKPSWHRVLKPLAFITAACIVFAGGCYITHRIIDRA